ncbi:toxin [Thermoactinomyces sp. DSM 45891]|uniref:hypothetical protein n=1 Tax=Thermoactinomyces sp. DSM 45891 TaxID=1761907 RepID=UPI0009161862|nr:hypothetical protein [Thermoactinomyces sp. DSM 45891]SFX65053.1 toxin [Thermoactinomyces sp. DSM 45891]
MAIIDTSKGGFFTKDRPAHLGLIHIDEDKDSEFQSIASVKDPQAALELLKLTKYFNPAVKIIPGNDEFAGGTELDITKAQQLAQALPDGDMDYVHTSKKTTSDLKIGDHIDQILPGLIDLISDVLADTAKTTLEALKKFVTDTYTNISKEQGSDKNWAIITRHAEHEISYTYQQAFGYESSIGSGPGALKLIRIMFLSSKVKVSKTNGKVLFLTTDDIATVENETRIIKVYKYFEATPEIHIPAFPDIHV